MSRTGFLPDRLRPGTRPRRPRRRLALMAFLPGVLLLLPLWRVQAVDVSGCPGLPANIEHSLLALEGTSPLTIDLDRVRRQVEVWPGVAAVEVYLELPGTLRITAQPATACASIRVGQSWHGVDTAGGLTGPLDGPLPPVLAGFRHTAGDLVQGLEVAERLRRATGGELRSVRRITPSDLEIGLEVGDMPMLVHVAPEATTAERLWCRQVAAGGMEWRWADLRWDSRMVVAQAAPEPIATDSGEGGTL